MALKIVRETVKPQVTKVDFKKHANTELLTWWYRSLLKGRSGTFQPRVMVCFRVLGANNQLTNDYVHRPIGLTELGQFRIGTIWRNGTCNEQIKLDEDTFQVDFDTDAWNYFSLKQSVAAGSNPAIPATAYELPQYLRLHETSLLQFPFSNDPIGLLIPSIEFFSRCYGRSQHVKRVLATYPWSIARSELLAPLVTPPEQGTWPINMKMRTVNGDAVLLAHLEYDPYARKQASSIWSGLEAAQGTSGNDEVFPQIGPWFQGPARIKVRGIWINEGTRFLGLHVVGCSDPGGVPVYRDRENTNKTGPIPRSLDNRTSWGGVPPQIVLPPQKIIDVTSSETPDHGTGSVEINDPDFEILGEPRLVFDMRRQTTKSTGGNYGDLQNPDRFSGDMTSGTGKGVGYASFKAEPIMESHGVLRDVWSMLKRLEALYPDIVQKVEYLTNTGDFSAGEEPALVGYEPFSREERNLWQVKEPNWPLLDTKNGMPRGALLARVSTPKGEIYFFEIQRRPRIVKKVDGDDLHLEESFKGLVFTLKDPSILKDWVQTVLNKTRYTCGVLVEVSKNCPGTAFTFKHTRATNQSCPQERPVIRALSLMGIEIFDKPTAQQKTDELSAHGSLRVLAKHEGLS